ncbi:MAG TPA: slipin family protein [Verrucomicrobiae bacterium]
MNIITLFIFAIFAVLAGAVIALPIVKTFRRTLIIPEGSAGLVYRHGLFVRRNNAGRQVVWGSGWTLRFVDLRRAQLLVAGQDVLTADSIALKFSLLVTYQVTEPIKAAHETQNWTGDLYQLTQIALRTVVSSTTIETLLGQKLAIGAQLLTGVKADAEKIGVHVLAVDVKDVMLPPDLKRAFAEVLKAKQEGQAALERARGESAALRSLANAARVLENNPALMNLRLLQSLTTAQNAGNTLVLGVPGGFLPVQPGTKTGAVADDGAS